ncbi:MULTISPECIES: TRAP transporter large permease [Pseudovibrio]|uniref:TRAP transporter large permease n=1 Tax=Stappiaceae TaxID=2821832 RepID=UPI0023651EB3|nr:MULTISPECIES: TRAP transporter large permease [Pseudovibrio]MDD7912081.1 TRAP transporter large permease [Pseudovibrio exalbescens]MDX5592431.1 TRAP transporter large permease [Pseudovibrio sp. SPO723]
MFWTTLFSALTLSAATGAALGAALGLTGLIILHFFVGGATSLALDAVWNVFNSFTLSAIPLFIVLGEILLRSGLSERVYSALSPAFTKVPGGLLHTNIAVCTLFGAVSGSSLSTAAAIGSVAYPEMTRRGYNKHMVVGSLAGGGTLGLLIPPSLSFLIFGALTETSIGQLFVAGILPGLLVSLMFMGYILLRCLHNPSLYPREELRLSPLQILIGTLRIWPILLLIFAIMGSITFGWATPTEAAAVGVGAAILIAFIWGDFTLGKLWEALYRAVQLYAAIGLVLIGATILAQSVALLGVPQDILELATSSGLNKYGILLLVVLVYLLLGCIFDGLSLMIMTLPIVFPLLTGLGFHPIWLGVMITIMIEIGQITPPVGLNLSVLSSLTKNEVPLGSAAISAIPYWLIFLMALVILTLFPQIALVLPAHFF